jgi:hypothetical protein
MSTPPMGGETAEETLLRTRTCRTAGLDGETAEETLLRT